ncbi:uncharacterized protein CLUP02_12971 [Colletotrichum lupini]|uniref:Uncharacterized protein n=1 Tax=Colletotrichum lupini TaxID=145971 RepID=A0A9Q8T1K1_9PEZI|nr:uncharacterized protein CLUP02_12971 [Colletotrichum lupini]UQC87466.1 hypothetical protein CLUP02_12971 [Colletotrichum lupini]
MPLPSVSDDSEVFAARGPCFDVFCYTRKVLPESETSPQELLQPHATSRWPNHLPDSTRPSNIRVCQMHGSFVTLCDGMRILICEGLSKLSLSLALAVSVLFTRPCKIFSSLHEWVEWTLEKQSHARRMIGKLCSVLSQTVQSEFKVWMLEEICPGGNVFGAREDRPWIARAMGLLTSQAYLVAYFFRFPAIFVGIELFFAVATYRDESEVYNVARSGSQTSSAPWSRCRPVYSPSQEIEAESGRHGPQPPMQEQGSDWRGLGSTP